MSTEPLIAVNGRFLTMTPTGVQRYAREILALLGRLVESRLTVVVPPARVVEIDDPQLAQIELGSRWHGIGGHRWEQVTLPRLVRRVRARALWSPCTWGPLAVRDQLVVVHDLAPLTHPEYYTRAYSLLARGLTPALVRRSRIVATPSRRVGAELQHRYRLDDDRLVVIAPGVGPPFVDWPLDDLDRRRGRYCILVGAHDTRKNPAFLLRLWPRVRARTGLELHLTRRSLVTTRVESSQLEGAGIVVHVDPTDRELAELYANALCLVWPSHYEGYGFPLLEAMAVGTPFLSTDVGAAAELAVAPDRQLLALDEEQWVERLVEWSSSDLTEIRRASAARAREQTWLAAAAATARLLDQLAR